MTKSFKNICLGLSLFVILSVSVSLSAEAFSLGNLNPITFLQKTTSIVVNRFSDFIYYLITQKQYLFDHLAYPNNVLSPLNIPTNSGEVSTSTVGRASTSSGTVPNNLTTVVTTAQPKVEEIVPATIPAPVQPTSTTPAGLVVEPSSAGGLSGSAMGQALSFNFGSQILALTNVERGNVSLPPLLDNSVLDTIASLRADDLFTNQYFEHSSPDGQSAIDLAGKFGYSYILIGENLALGTFNGDQGIVSAWMGSPEHRANILNGKYTELGTSVKTGFYKGENVTIAVQIFGTPATNCPKPNPATKDLIDSSTASVKQMQAEALAIYSNLNTIKNSPNLDQAYYNQKVQEYNYLAKKVNDAIIALKSLIDFYNLGVARYNSCISS